MESLRTVISRLFVDIHDTPTPVIISVLFFLFLRLLLETHIYNRAGKT